MRRACFELRISEGTEETYERLHVEMDDALRRTIRESGLRNYTLFRFGTRIIGYVEATPDLDSALAVLAETKAFQAWAEEFEGIFVHTVDGRAAVTELREIWHVD